ncbi:MAG: serine/threonine-protein kinase [Planctomycetota bacterium]
MAPDEEARPDEAEEETFLETGARLGRFVILGELGRGSMGVVYEAFQEDLKRKVALKVLPANISLDAKHVRRFRREAQAAARLQHPNLIQIFEVGHEEKTHFIAMELIEGGPFERFEARTEEEVREAARIARDAARGLAHAHEQGVIHRDIKPGNLLVSRSGRVAVTDFGLARQTDTATLTSTDAIVGTPKYMSPEQILGGDRPLDGRTDVYSLAAALYEVVAARPPLEAPSVQAYLRAVLEERPPNPRRFNRRIPSALATILLRALEKDPSDRYPDAGAFADDLGRFLAGERIVARPKGRFALALELVRRRPLLAGLSALTAIALFTVVAVSLRARQQSEKLNVEAAIRRANRRLDPDARVQDLERLARRRPEDRRVRQELRRALLGRALRHLEGERPDFGRALTDVEAAGDPFWRGMLLVELKRFAEAQDFSAGLAERAGMLADPEEGKRLRAIADLTRARVHLQRQEYDEAQVLLPGGDLESLPQELQRPYFPFTRGLVYRGMALRALADGSGEDGAYLRLLAEAHNDLKEAIRWMRGTRQIWLQGRIYVWSADVDKRLGREPDLRTAALVIGGTAGGLFETLTDAWAGATQRETNIAQEFVRDLLNLIGLPPDLPLTLKEKAEKMLGASPAPRGKEAVRWLLLRAVASMSGNDYEAAKVALLDASLAASDAEEDTELRRMRVYVHWGLSLLYQRSQGQLRDAFQEAFFALDIAGKLEAFGALQVLAAHLCVLGEEARGAADQEYVGYAVSRLESALRRHPDLEQTVRPFLSRARASSGAGPG